MPLKQLPVRRGCQLAPARLHPRTPRHRTRETTRWQRLVDYLVREAERPHSRSPMKSGIVPVLEVITQLRQPLMYSSFERPVLRRREDGDYLQVLRGRRRHQLANRREQLEKELGEVRLVDRAHEAEARERFLELEQSGWKGEAGTAMASTPPATRRSFGRWPERSQTSAGQLPSLETANSAVLAMAVRVLADGGVFQLKITYNESYRELGPGRMLDLELLPYFTRTTTAMDNSCTDPGNESRPRCSRSGGDKIDTVIVPADGRVNGMLRGGATAPGDGATGSGEPIDSVSHAATGPRFATHLRRQVELDVIDVDAAPVKLTP